MKVLINREVGEVREARRIQNGEWGRQEKGGRLGGGREKSANGKKDRDAQVGHGSNSTSEDQATQRNEVADPPGSHRWPRALAGGRGQTGCGTDRKEL